MNKFLTNDEILALESTADDVRFSAEPSTSKELHEKACRAGSGSACISLAGAYEPQGKVFPEAFDALFVKSRRRSIRYYNRAFKCLRRQARLGSYPAMFNLYNMHGLGYERSVLFKNRSKLAEYWLRKAAGSGHEIPVAELRAHLRSRDC